MSKTATTAFVAITGHCSISCRPAAVTTVIESAQLAPTVPVSAPVMKLTVLAAVAAMILGTAALAAGGHCDEDLKAVDAAMSKAKLSDADMAKVKAARAKAGDLHKANKEEECEKSLAEAQKLLGIKDSHKH